MHGSVKDEARRRALGRCEYCHVPDAHVLTPFQADHVIARKHRRSDELINIAYSCLRCNLHKGSNLTGIDPHTGKVTRLYNPRRQNWSRHFRWEAAVIVGKTSVGRTTVEVLAMNNPDRLAVREELIEQGLMPID
jgi:5-methylcytosine-specific restriction endonuclease McrA